MPRIENIYILKLTTLDIHMQRNESRHRPYVLHENQLKMDHCKRPKCKRQNYKPPR